MPTVRPGVFQARRYRDILPATPPVAIVGPSGNGSPALPNPVNPIKIGAFPRWDDEVRQSFACVRREALVDSLRANEPYEHRLHDAMLAWLQWEGRHASVGADNCPKEWQLVANMLLASDRATHVRNRGGVP